MINNFIIYRIFANLVAFWIAGKIIPGFVSGELLSLLSAAVIITFLHMFIRPILTVLTLPLQIFTLGFAYLIFNALYVSITCAIVSDMKVSGFFSALGVAVVISFVSIILDGLARSNRHKANRY